MSKSGQLLEKLEDLESMDEMATMPERRTGVPCYIYASPRQGSHGARIKLSLTSRSRDSQVSISISPNPEIVLPSNGKLPPGYTNYMIAQAKRWVIANLQHLIKMDAGGYDDTSDFTTDVYKNPVD